MTKLLLFCTVFLSIVVYSRAQSIASWPEASQTSKPWTRWWWMDNAVDKENISRELKEFSESGIGGVEITPIYGVKGEEQRSIEFLTNEFSEILNFTIKQAGDLGMGVDLPPGSGWRCGGPFVPEEKGLWNLRIKKYELKAGEEWILPETDENVTAISFVSGDKAEKIGKTGFSVPRDGTVYLALREKSGNKVKRPSKGGEGWAVDTFNKEVTNWYLKEFWERLGVDEGKLRCFFHDSFEYTGDFTTDFLEEFKRRRAYDLTDFLHVLAGDCEDAEMVRRVKSDYRETLADLVLESFIKPMTEWANAHQSLNRNQAHGSPGNILDLYAACDIPETEIFRSVKPGTVDVFVNKFASSAAHVTGQKLVSSESFTWLDEHWTVTPTDLVRATNRFFLAGINHMFFHGSCYSPEDAGWPGWLFYASTQMNNRNPLWREMPTLFKYIERTQTILQKSEPVNDLLIYWPYFDVAAGDGRIFNHLGVNKDAGWFVNHPISGVSDKLMNAGYTFDYVSDMQLADCMVSDGKIMSSGKAEYKAVVIPKTEYIPLETMTKLMELVANGARVIFDEELPRSVPGMFNLEERENRLRDMKSGLSREEVCGDSEKLLVQYEILGERSLAERGFHHLKMKRNNEDWYLIFNTGLETKDEWIELNSSARSYVLMNPMTGEISQAKMKNSQIRLQLEPEEICFVRCTEENSSLEPFYYQEKSDERTEIEALWKIEFLEGGPILPGNIQSNKLQSWTEQGGSEAQQFSGTVKYSTEFYWGGSSKSGVLNLGEVKDCAHVFLNGNDLGARLGPWFKIKTDKLQKGSNKMEIYVTNVAANRIRDLDKRGVEWRKFHDINFVNIEYKPFDASGWEVRPAGLLGPVSISYD